MLVFSCLTFQAQTYHPFPTKNAIWSTMYYHTWGEIISDKLIFHCYAMKNGDTLINKKLYHKIYHSVDTLFTEDKLCGGIREENKRIYFYPIDSITYPLWETYPSKKEEFILYDFSLKEGDLINSDTFRLSIMDYPGNLKVFKIDSILIGQQYRKAFHFGSPYDSVPLSWAIWVEGIGHLRGLMFPTGYYPGDGIWSDLICFHQEHVELYHNLCYKECFYQNIANTNVIKDDVGLTIKPNPAKISTIIDFNGFNYSRLKIVNLYGEVCRTYSIKGMTTIEIYKENLPSGIYILIVEDNQKNVVTTKLVFE